MSIQSDSDDYLSDGWDAAILRMLELQQLRGAARPKHEMVDKLYQALSSYAKSWEVAEASGDDASLLSLCGSIPTSQWGAILFERWLKFDVEFFDDLARVLRTLGGVHKDKVDAPLELRVIEAAWGLAERLKRDPTRAEVMDECERLDIRPVSWHHMWRRCRLGFLAGAGRGSPKGKRGAAKRRTRSKK